jgi:hypothetical protein
MADSITVNSADRELPQDQLDAEEHTVTGALNVAAIPRPMPQCRLRRDDFQMKRHGDDRQPSQGRRAAVDRDKEVMPLRGLVRDP